MKMSITFLIVLLAAACMPLNRSVFVSEDEKMFQEAKTYFAAGNYDAARKIYRDLETNQPRSPLAEQAAFNAAYILVHHENQKRDYGAAEAEFTEFIRNYPQGALAGEARSWIDIIRRSDPSSLSRLRTEAASLTQRVEVLTREVQDATENERKILEERDALLVIKESLSGKIDALIKEKEVILNEKTALLAEKNSLAQDKTQLLGRVEALTQEKRTLTSTKKKLEKSLHDLTMVDVRMEKRRKKIKKEETTDSRKTTTK